mgnify:CR=1 FL=1
MPTDNSIYIFVPCSTKSSPTGKLSFFPAGLPVLFSLSLNLFPVLCNDPFHACPVDPAYGDAGSVHQTDFLVLEPGEVTSVDQIISVDSEEAFLHSCKFPFHSVIGTGIRYISFMVKTRTELPLFLMYSISRYRTRPFCPCASKERYLLPGPRWLMVR